MDLAGFIKSVFVLLADTLGLLLCIEAICVAEYLSYAACLGIVINNPRFIPLSLSCFSDLRNSTFNFFLASIIF